MVRLVKNRGWTQKQQRAETKQLTHKATLSQPGSRTKQDKCLPLADAIDEQHHHEVASFHTPGHKGISPFEGAEKAWQLDITELPGLDELSNPSGLLKSLEKSASRVWGSRTSLISVNGASAALSAAILACANRGKRILLPRNVHRSAIHALVLSGLEPVWYDPCFDKEWSTWTNVPTTSVEHQLQKFDSDLACVVVVSPTYTGCSSDVQALSTAAHSHGIPLIVDEAHGAHRIANSSMPPSAVTQGADAVVHSLHKTLSALTQTGILHLSQHSLIDDSLARAALNLLQSSSPSYLLMTSIEHCIAQLEVNDSAIKAMQNRCTRFAKRLSAMNGVKLFAPAFDAAEPTHFLMRLAGATGAELADRCASRGIYAEAVFGGAVLFLAGIGTTEEDFENLLVVLHDVHQESVQQPWNGGSTCSSGTKALPRVSGSTGKALPNNSRQAGFDDHSNGTISSDQSADDYLAALPFCFGEQVLTPRVAFFSAVETVSFEQSIGRIAADCIAPCPPGTPVVVPGQRITHEVASVCRRPLYRVVVESSIQGEQ